MEDGPPISQRAYRTSPTSDKIIKEEIDKGIKNGLIRLSTSPWASPVTLVKKKNGKWRFCVDYRKLNNVTKKDRYPLPLINKIIDRLGGSKWFTSIDLASEYWQVEVAEEDKEKRILFKNAFSSCSLFIFMSLTSWYLRTFSIDLPYIELFMSLKKSFSKAFLAPCCFSVLNTIYGVSQLVWSNERI